MAGISLLFVQPILDSKRSLFTFTNATIMTAAQSLKLFELLNKSFKNPDDAKAMVNEIEAVIENRFIMERDRLSTKEDLAKTETRIILWIVGFNTALAGLIIAALKLL